jgi:hypothetical protein
VGGGIRGAGFGAAVRGADFANVIKQVFFEKRTKNLLLGCRGLLGDSQAKVLAAFFKKQRLLPFIWR